MRGQASVSDSFLGSTDSMQLFNQLRYLARRNLIETSSYGKLNSRKLTKPRVEVCEKPGVCRNAD